MCLVTLYDSNQCTILTSNRDESPSRNASKIETISIKNKNVTFPLDLKGGTWIASSDHDELVCLLNGAFEQHTRRLPYKMSRGVMLKIFFEYNTATDFLKSFDFFNIEPFTMIISTDYRNLEFRWDGKLKHINTLKMNRLHIWSSATLYDKKNIEKRKIRVENLLHDKEINASNLLNAHLTSNSNDFENDLIMNRGELIKTVSTTQIVKTENKIILKHIDLLNNDISHTQIK